MTDGTRDLLKGTGMLVLAGAVIVVLIAYFQARIGAPS